MRSVRGVLLLVLTAALCGCASGETAGKRWGIDENPDEGVKLTLGVPGTDDVAMMMVCRPHSGVVSLTIIGERTGVAALELRSGKVSGRYAGVGVYDDESDGGFDISFQLKADDPVLVQMAENGELSAVLGRRRMVLPKAFAPFHDFVMACRKPAA